MPTGVELQFQLQIDNIAAYNEAIRNVTLSRSKLWTLVDAANDETYENTIKGSTITDLDTKMTQGNWGDGLRQWYSLHNTYYSSYAGITGVTSVKTAIEYYRWRVAEEFHRYYNTALGTMLDTDYVYASNLLQLATFDQTTQTFTPVDTINATYAGASKLAVVTTSSIGASDWDITLTTTLSDATSDSVLVTVPNGSGVGVEVVLGEELLTGNVSAAATVLPVADTTYFIAGTLIVLEDNSNAEVCTIVSVQTNTSVTVAAIRNAYTTAASAKITPLYTAVTAMTSANGTNGDECEVRPVAERTLTL